MYSREAVRVTFYAADSKKNDTPHGQLQRKAKLYEITPGILSLPEMEIRKEMTGKPLFIVE